MQYMAKVNERSPLSTFKVMLGVALKHNYLILWLVSFIILDVHPRTFHQEVAAVWNDKAVVMSDCQGRMSDYRYGLYSDTDEFIIPNVDDLRNAWETYAVRIFSISLLL